MDTEQIRESMKALENAQDSEYVLEILTKLNKQVQPTEKLLRETKLGVAVNKLRGHENEKVSSLVIEMIGRWREQVTAQKEKLKAQKKAASSSKPDTAAASSAPGAPSQSKPPAKEFKSDKPRSAKGDGVTTSVYSDKTRNSCVEVIYNALCIDSSEQPGKILEVGKKVEAAVFTAEKGTSPEYRTKIRSLFSNLKNPKNPELRARVLAGDIPADRLVKMTPQELAPSELRQEMEKINKQNLFNAQGAKEQRATTDRFTCSKCKQKKVSYSQMQTRSADEPLTTFCQCENCGNRWKFS